MLKKNIYRTLIILLLIFSIYGFNNFTYGADITGKPWSLCDIEYTRSEQLTEDNKYGDLNETSILEMVNSYIIDDNNKYETINKTPLIIKTKVTVTSDPFNTNGRKVKIGNRFVGEQSAGIIQNRGLFYSEEDPNVVDVGKIIEYLGYEEPGKDEADLWLKLTTSGEEISWDIIIVADVKPAGIIADGDYTREYNITVSRVLTGADMEKAKDIKTEDVEIFDDVIEEAPNESALAQATNKAGEILGTIWDFATHPIKSSLTLLLDGVKIIFGDFPQTVANLFQSGLNQWSINYSTDALKSDKHKELAKYVDIQNRYESDSQESIPIVESSKDEEKYKFDKNTKIPVITVDIYTMAADKVDLMRANFFKKTIQQGDEELTADQLVKENKWLVIRNLFASIIHAVMYITAAALVIGIIINGVKIVLNTFISPAERKKKIDTLQRFSQGVIMLVATLLIEALCLGASNVILGDVGMGDTYEGPIRVKVDSAGYSFSTTPTGYVRYMADISNIHMYQQKAIYVLAYVILAWANLITAFAMFARMLMLMFLSVIGFIIVLKYVMGFDKNGMLKYKNWVITYATISAIQVFLAIISRLMVEGLIIK